MSSLLPFLKNKIRPRLFRSRLLLIAILATLTLAGPSAHAIIDASLQMQLGNPSGATADTNNHQHYLIQRTVEAIDYSDTLGEPNWASWDLTAGDIGSSGRSPNFFVDTTLPAGFYEVGTGEYSGSGYDRGHMCPSADRTDNDTDNALVFYMSNIIPQAPQNNQGVWANFESYCRTLATSGNELLIICGPSVFTGSRLPTGHVAIPTYTWKIVVVVPNGAGTALSRITAANRVIAIKVPNNNSVNSAWQTYVTSAAQIEVDTGFTFFTALPADVASVLRNKVDGQIGPPPGITGFSPPTSGVGDSVVITGTNFTSATAVTFNGESAIFSVNSATQIIATVPTNATSGAISVTTPNGTGLSSSSFVVTGSAADLAITKTHFGNFTQGDVADTYTLTVMNVGSLPTSDTVTVVDALPAGLTATGISGIGWTTDLNTLTCTRSDALPAGASYPAINVIVSVDTNAPGSVTNTATVSGGGETNLLNDTASNPTIINTSSGTNGATVLFGWDVHSLPGGANNYGPSPYAATTADPNLTVGGLTRGSGVGTSNTGAQRAWGGNAWTAASAATAITANQFTTFTVSAQAGYKVSLTSISHFDYRRSATGPQNGVLQYSVGGGAFTDITALSYPSATNIGGSLNPINLTGIPALQNVGPGMNVTFRIVNYGGGSSGTWYIFDTNNNTGLDFSVSGVVAPVVTSYPDVVISGTHAGDFVQGDSGDIYTLTVTNIGTAATVGAVIVVDALPAGLTATSISGDGWSADLGTLTCARSESLAPGVSYPPINVIVDVSTNAQLNLTNTVTVSGGGEINTSNDTASDPTVVVALTPIQSWRLQWFGSTNDFGDSGDSAIVTSDDMPNLVKYAFGLDPLVSAANPVVVDISTGYLRISVPKNPDATDITFLVETTDNLSNPWTTDGIIIDQNTPTFLQAHFAVPVGSVDSCFMRVRITRP